MTEPHQHALPLDGSRPAPVILAPGLVHYPGYLDGDGQAALLAAVRAVLAAAPPFTPRMPRTGKPFSVRMTNAGPLGWVSDERGYRYQPRHPETGEPWPPIPASARLAWDELGGYPHPPEACLVNLYGPEDRMGLHQDRDEEDFGDTALFRYGGTVRKRPTRSLRLRSGDALVLGGPARLAFHGIDRLLPGTSDLLPEGGRINLTLRRVSRP